MPPPTQSTPEEQHAAAIASRDRLSVLVEIHHAAHVIVLNADDVQQRHQEIADLADRALVDDGVLVPSAGPTRPTSRAAATATRAPRRTFAHDANERSVKRRARPAHRHHVRRLPTAVLVGTTAASQPTHERK